MKQVTCRIISGNAGWRSGKQVIALWKLLEHTEKETSKSQADNMDEASNMDDEGTKE